METKKHIGALELHLHARNWFAFDASLEFLFRDMLATDLLEAVSFKEVLPGYSQAVLMIP